MINFAEGQKRGYVLEGEGEAVRILNEARSTCESIINIASSVDENSSNANLKLKLTEKYLETLNKIYNEARLI